MNRILLLMCSAVLALGLAAQAGASETQRPPDRSQANRSASEASTQANAKVSSEPFPIVVVESEPQSKDRADAEKRSTEHDRLDLLAQEKAADAAHAQVVPNRISAALTVIGTLALLCTLILTQRSLNLSRQTAIAELRAYLGVHSYKAVQRDGRLMLSLLVQNFGNTPAVRLRCGWSIMTGPPGPIPTEFSFQTPPDSTQEVGLLTPNGEFNFGPGILSPAKVAALNEGKVACFIFGWLDYDDTLPNTPRRRLEFCTQVEPSEAGDGSDIYRFAATPRHNAMDDDCESPPLAW